MQRTKVTPATEEVTIKQVRRRSRLQKNESDSCSKGDAVRQMRAVVVMNGQVNKGEFSLGQVNPMDVATTGEI